MPFKVFKKKRKTKRAYKKRSYRRKRQSLFNRYTPSGLPTQRVTAMRYNDVIQLSSTSGVLATHYFRANSLYDPDYTSAGHQPMGFDTMATMYNHYTVLGSKITVRVRNPASSSASQVPYYIGCYLTDDLSTGYTTASEFIESKRGTSRIGQWIYPLSLSNKYSAKRFFNLTDVKDNSQLKSAVTTNPTEAAYYALWLEGVGPDTLSVSLDVTMEFIVSWSEPKELAQS